MHYHRRAECACLEWSRIASDSMTDAGVLRSFVVYKRRNLGPNNMTNEPRNGKSKGLFAQHFYFLSTLFAYLSTNFDFSMTVLSRSCRFFLKSSLSNRAPPKRQKRVDLAKTGLMAYIM